MLGDGTCVFTYRVLGFWGWLYRRLRCLLLFVLMRGYLVRIPKEKRLIRYIQRYSNYYAPGVTGQTGKCTSAIEVTVVQGTQRVRPALVGW
jgi:hypothetical protein